MTIIKATTIAMIMIKHRIMTTMIMHIEKTSGNGNGDKGNTCGNNNATILVMILWLMIMIENR